MPAMTAVKSLNEYLLDHVEKWRIDHPNEPWDNDDIAQWMLDNDLWRPERRRLRKELSRLLAKSEKNKRVRNPQGNLVREYHAIIVEAPGTRGITIQKTLWDTRLNMSASHANISFQRRWDQTAGQAKSLFQDQEDFNNNNSHADGNRIQLGFDFSFVVEGQAKQVVDEVPQRALPDSIREAPRADVQKPR